MGRPRSFEPEDALDAIKNAFWHKGYEGTSMHDIETASGLKKQSLYRLFGGKREMYLRALVHYEQNEVQAAGALLQEPGTAKERFARLFNRIVDHAIETGDRRGCLLCNASVDQAQLDPETKSSVEDAMSRVHKAFKKALAVSAPYANNTRKHDKQASALMAFYFGLRVLIKSNMPDRVLRDAVRAAVEEI